MIRGENIELSCDGMEKLKRIRENGPDQHETLPETKYRSKSNGIQKFPELTWNILRTASIIFKNRHRSTGLEEKTY